MFTSGYLPLLRSGRYLPFFLSQILTNLADGLLAVAIVYFAVSLDASPWQLGVITFMITLSRGFLGPLGGVIGDRVDKRWYLIGIEALRAGLTGLMFLLFVSGQAGIWMLMAFGVAVSTLFAVSVPAAKTIIPKLARPEELQPANGLIQTITWPAYFLGSGLLAALLPLGLEDAILLVAAAVFGVSGLLLLGLPKIGREARPDAKGGFVADLVQGYSEMRSDSVMHARVWAYGIFTFFWRGSLQILIPLAVLTHLRSPDWVFGALMLVNGAAEFAANLVVGRLRLRRPLVFTFSCEALLGLGILLVASGFVLPVPEIGLFAGVFMIGIAAATIDIPLLTVIQTRVSSHNVGKVVSYWFTIGSAGGALGNLLLGIYFEFVPFASGTFLLGVLLALAGLAMIRWAQVNNTVTVPLPLAEPERS